MSERNTGKWTEEEVEWFQQGVDQFGNDYAKLEEHMGGARNRKQIRHYYSKAIKKDPEFFSPKKRKASGAATATPAKKTKAGEAKTPPPSAKRATRSAPASTAKSSARTPAKKAPPANDSDEESSEEIKAPPAVKKTPAKKPAAKSTAPAPAPTRRSSRIAEKAKEAEEEEVKEQNSLVEFFNKEEVQLVLAGILGFVVVMIAKKLMA